MNATVRGITGERYDPPASSGHHHRRATIAADFNPLIQGSSDDDTGGDDLSNLEVCLGAIPSTGTPTAM